ncbi:MetQ/NlpA family ABC transporter substrate-binding protein [Amycolatopsis sp. CA-230715]|uniref:MetQ/NlpA family ABC transporter substrate-binding protein n=1 Tax=Amycolatopsis sp. CA-230715 TaxID=2745196 RepID=UPI001C021E1D|nr:MetQ/NlpA family ABC transporter substrate-binding protein [Amycolatopsis sp. CA-230715]QWF84100.1 hypothetical protein HUW46_07544 [Amycolatopsis sp. CA-230715]
MPDENTPDTPETDEVGLPKRAANRRPLLFGGLAVVIVAVLVVVFVVVNNSGGSAGSKDRASVKIGVTDASKEYWTTFKKLASDEGIDVELVNFSAYTEPNRALSQKQVDLNLFQHLLFLANYNVSNNDTIAPIGATYVVPLSLYSQKHKDLAAVPAGGTIAIPNDPTNQARALLVLQSAGLVKLKGGGTVLSTPAEIDTAASKVGVRAVDPAQTAAALPSVDGSIVNNNYALDARLDPSKALYNDDPRNASAEPYINIVAARAEDKGNPTYQRIVALYKDKRIAEQVQADSKGTSVFVDRPGPELEGVLAKLSDTVRAAKK